MPRIEKLFHTHCRPGKGLNQKLVTVEKSGRSHSPMIIAITPATIMAGTKPALVMSLMSLLLLPNFTLPNPLENSRNRPSAQPMDQEMGYLKKPAPPSSNALKPYWPQQAAKPEPMRIPAFKLCGQMSMIFVAMPVTPKITYIRPRISSRPTRAYIRSGPSKFNRNAVMSGTAGVIHPPIRGSPKVLLTMYSSSWTNTMDKAISKVKPNRSCRYAVAAEPVIKTTQA